MSAPRPIITANWLTAGDKAWTLPVGAQVGRVVKIGGKLPVNFALGAYYNALRPEFGPTLAASYPGHPDLLTDCQQKQARGFAPGPHQDKTPKASL